MPKKSTEERIRACIGRHPDWADGRIAVSMNCPIGEVRAIKMGLSLPQEAVPASSPKVNLVSLEKVIERYDIKSAIIKELANLPRGQLISEADLCQKAAGFDRNRFRRTVENNQDEFRPLRIKLKLDDSGDGKLYWGHPEDVAEAQRMRDL